MARMGADIVKYIILAVFVIIGVLMWRAWQDKQASAAWPWVEGVVTHAEVEREMNDPHEGLTQVGWRLALRYDYTVGGQAYTGHRRQAMPERFPTEAQARRVLAPYPAGTRVKVFYDPAKPASSVLEPG